MALKSSNSCESHIFLIDFLKALAKFVTLTDCAGSSVDMSSGYNERVSMRSKIRFERSPSIACCVIVGITGSKSRAIHVVSSRSKALQISINSSGSPAFASP